MVFSIKLDIVKSRWSIVSIEGSQVIISKNICISFSEDRFCRGEELVPIFHTCEESVPNPDRCYSSSNFNVTGFNSF